MPNKLTFAKRKMKTNYSWGVNGFGRQFITENGRDILMCCLPGSAKYYCLVLEEQEKG